MMTRRFAAVGLALALAGLALPATVRAQSYSYNYQSKNLSESVYCYEYDPDTGFYTYYLSAYASDGREHVPGGGPNDYTYGYVYYETYDKTTGELCSGYGQVTDQSISSKLTSASMSATVTMDCYDTTTIDPNTGYYTYIETKTVPVSITLTGTGDTYKSRYSSTYQNPPFYKSAYSSSGTFRDATDTTLVDGQQISPENCYGNISSGKSSSSVHYNSHPHG